MRGVCCEKIPGARSMLRKDTWCTKYVAERYLVHEVCCGKIPGAMVEEKLGAGALRKVAVKEIKKRSLKR